MWAKVVLAAVSCKRRAAALVDTPTESVEVVADELDSHEVASVIDLDHASLSRQACDTLSKACRGWTLEGMQHCGGAHVAAAGDPKSLPFCGPERLTYSLRVL